MIDFTKYKTEKELREFCKELFTTNQLLVNKIKSLEETVKHSEELLKNIPLPPATEQDLEELLYREIAYMDKLSKTTGLNAEETKQLKMVIDSIVNLQRQKSGVKEEPKRKRISNDPAKLIKLAKQPEGS